MRLSTAGGVDLAVNKLGENGVKYFKYPPPLDFPTFCSLTTWKCNGLNWNYN